jgi:Tfp pilus assembly protein PilF
MKITRIVSGIVIAAFVSVSCASMSKEERHQKATAHYQLGLSYLNDNNIQPAYVEFQKALEFNPENKDVLNIIGVIYLLKLENYQTAAEHFQRALAIDKNFSEASNNLGLAYEKMGRFSVAVESYKTALKNPLYRGAEKAFNNMGRAYYRAKKYNDSLDAYKEAIRRYSDFHLPYYGLALCYNAMGRYGEAAIALRKAVELDPVYKGDKEKAIKDMQEKKLIVKGHEEKDLDDLLEIMNY